MRNLKKILALVLALVMSFSLMATANAFTDSEKITDTYETAVTVLDGLKVFQGYDDGSFQPQGSITRAEVATIIYRIVTGDVEGKQVGIYADYNKFNDVKSTSWYAGYVNFCANAEYIKGRDAKTFDPNAYVTGYEALAMILRAIGYDKNGEFTGSNWQVQTAATGELRGITKNITEGTLGTYASREVVAEILFQTILVDTVNYTPAFGYQLNDTSLGWDTFELEEISGVVVANEYADLYGTKPLKAGKTELDVDGESYTLAYTTTFDDIGEARDAYVTGETVLYIADAGNTVFETGAEADIATASKFEKVTGMERTTTTEQFVNFDGGNTYEASDYRIGYVIAAANIDVDTTAEETAFVAANGGEFSNAANGTRVYEKDISRGAALTSTDMDIIEMIFDDADFENNSIVIGEVYVGTQSNDDISDEISYNKFLDEYIETNENAVTVDENENGNWLKVIDNDGDGEADVILQVIYTVAGVQKVAKDGTITLSCEDDTFDNDDALNEITDDNDVVTEDELAEGDIVYYALIDGNAYTYKAEVVTAKIDKVNRNTYTATTTDGDEYVESGVHEHTAWAEIVSGVRNLEGNVNYDLYLDRFGYLAAFTESDNNAGFVLLTDGYYETGRTSDTFAAMVWDREAQELVDTDITDGGELFISTNGDDNDWGNLRPFNPINCNGNNDIHTIVAALGEDGSLTPVDEIYRYRMNVAMIDMDTTIPDRAHTENGTIYSTTRNGAYDEAGASVDVRALASTVYYYVYNTPNGNTVVREYVGYANIPDLGKDADKVEDVYVVGTRAEDARDDEYYTAEIVVVELMEGYTEIDSEEVFIYDLPVASAGVKYEDVSVIRADGTAETVTIDLSKSDLSAYREYDPALGKYIMPGLYYMWESDVKDVYVVSKMSWNDIADSRYVVGTVLKDTATGADDWTSFTPYFNNTNSMDFTTIDSVADFWAQFVIIDSMGETEKKNTADTKYYELDYSENKYGDYVGDLTEGDREDVLPQRKDGGDNEVLVKYNSDNEIVYAISFAQWENESKYIVDFAQDVYAFNTPAAAEIVVSDYEKAVAAAEDALAANPHVKGDLEEALKLLNDLDTTSLTVEQEAYVNALVADIGTALQPFADAEALAEAQEDAIDAMKTAIVAAVETADTGDIIKDYEAVLTDDTTVISIPAWGAGYETVKKALDKWTEEINGKGTIAEVNSQAAAIAGNYASLASAYVAAVAANQTTAGYKALAAAKAEAYMTAIKAALKTPIAWTGSTTLAGEVESAIDTACSTEASDPEYTLTVTAGDFETGAGVSGTKTVEVEVSVTNSYAGVVCDPVTETIAVIISW